MADLVIKISGDIKNFNEALENAKKKTEDLSDNLKTTAEISGIAFIALSATIGFTVAAYREQEKATAALTSAMQQQGIYSKDLVDNYRQQAEEIEKKTGIDAEQIITGQALLQSQIGQTTVTKDLTKAVVDFAARQKIDVAEAFNLVAKATNNGTEILKRHGLTVQDGATRAETLSNIQKALAGNFEGSAEAAAHGLGIYSVLHANFENLAKSIGEKFVPALVKAGELLNDVVSWLQKSPEVVNFGVAVLVASTAVAALVTLLATASIGFLAFKAALVAAGIEMGVTAIAARVLVGATGIGLILIVIAELYQHWNTVFPAMKAIYESFAQSIIPISKALGEILIGAFTFDLNLLKKGMEDAKTVFQQGVDKFNEVHKKSLQDQAKEDQVAEDAKKDKNAKDAASREAEDRDRRARAKAAKDAEQAVAVAQANRESKEIIDIKKQEAEITKQIADDKNKAIRSQLEKHLADLKEMELSAEKQDQQNRKTFNTEILGQNKAYHQMTEEEQNEFNLKYDAQIRGQLLTEKQARDQNALDEAKKDVDAHNTMLKNQQKFGIAYAMIYKVMHSEILQGFSSASTDLAALQSSSNSTLKGIGQVAAISNIVIKTAESAMNIYAGFSTIPIIGPVLGVAAAAAAIAFGAEQIGKVSSANQGGVIPGGGPDRDSVLSFLTPGELVVPRSNFDEVIGSVASSRGIAPSGQAGGDLNIVMSLKDNLMDFIELQLVKRRNLKISYQG